MPNYVLNNLKANFKNLFEKDLAIDVIFLVLLSVNNDLFIYIFATGVGCKTRYVSITELKDIPYFSARVACTINFSVKETWMLRLKEGSKYLTTSLKKKRHIWGSK